MRRYAEALPRFDRAIKLELDYAWAIAGKGEVLPDLGRYDEALSLFDRAIELDPNFVSAIIGKGETLRRMGNYEEALPLFDRVIALDPARNDWALYAKGQMLISLGQHAVAMEVLQPIFDEGSVDDSLLFLLGLCCTHTGMADQARLYYHQAIERARAYLKETPKNTRVRFNLALYLLISGKKEEALQQYQSCLSYTPAVLDIREAIQDIFFASEQLGPLPGADEAMTMLRASLQPNDD